MKRSKTKDFTPFKDRKDHDWSDIQPLAQCDGEFPILKTRYPPEYEELMGYFRRVSQNGELSKRVYDLTTEVINWICGSYTAWYVRRQCVLKLGISLDIEFKFVEEMFPNNEKNYQLWEYKRFLAVVMKTPEKDIEFIDNVLRKENKNYHAWSYRIWLCQEFNLFNSEIKKLDFYLTDDVGNNSAWNYRYFLLHKTIDSVENLKKEIAYVKEKIVERPENEAAWNYLQGWFHMYSFKVLDPNPEAQIKHLKKFHFKDCPEVEEFCVDISIKNPDIRFSFVTLVNIYLLKGDKTNTTKVIEILDDLAANKDKIRYIYWGWFKQQVLNQELSVMS
jgi:protein farnesyltransferase/geranylgeranyltransferase type-1 subunit alpha